MNEWDDNVRLSLEAVGAELDTDGCCYVPALIYGVRVIVPLYLDALPITGRGEDVRAAIVEGVTNDLAIGSLELADDVVEALLQTLGADGNITK